MNCIITLPFKLESRANFRGHTRSRKHTKAIREQRSVTQLVLSTKATKPKLPCTFCLTRIAPRALDRHENLPMSFKAVVDGICDWLGVDDRDERLFFVYKNEKPDTPRTYGCRIEFECEPTSSAAFKPEKIAPVVEFSFDGLFS